MNKLLAFFTIIFISNWGFNQIYFQTAHNQLEEGTTEYEYDFVNAPTTGTMLYNPKLHIQLKGDFNTTSKGFELYDQDDNLIHSFSNITSRCKDTTLEYTMTEAEYLSYVNANDSLILQLKLLPDVDPNFCDVNYVYISLEVNYCSGPTTDYLTPTITFLNDSYCTGQGIIPVQFWPIGGVVSGEGVVQNGNNYHINSNVLLPDTTYEYLYKQTNQHGCEFIGRNSIRIKKSPEDIDLTVCPNTDIVVNTPAYWYDDAQRLNEIGNGIQITPTHTAGTETYYLSNYQLRATADIDTLTLEMVAGLIVKDASHTNAIPKGGFAITQNFLYLGTGDTTIVMDPNTLNLVKQVKKRHSFFSDLATGKLFTFYNTTLAKAPNGQDFTNGVFDAIAELDEDLEMTGIIHQLPKEIKFDEISTIASGFGEVFYSNGQDQSYIFELSTFTISDFYPRSFMVAPGTNFATYGFLLRNNGEKNLYLPRPSSSQIIKTDIETLNETVIGTFLDSINGVNDIAFSPWSFRWYLSNTATDQLSDMNFERTIASAKVLLPGGIVFDTLDNCVSQATVMIPSIDLGSDVTICEYNAPYTVTIADDYFNYTWNGNLTNQATYDVASPGVVTLEVLDVNGCTLTDNMTVTFDPCLSVEEVEGNKIQVYPNPTTGIVTISSSMEEGRTLSVLDLNGRQLQEIQLNGSVQEINLSSYTTGVYLLSIESSNGEINMVKVIKE